MLKKIKKCLVLLLAISLLIGCSAKNSGGNVGTETAVSSIAETGTAISENFDRNQKIDSETI